MLKSFVTSVLNAGERMPSTILLFKSIISPKDAISVSSFALTYFAGIDTNLFLIKLV